MKLDEFTAQVYLYRGLYMKEKIKLIKFAKIFDPYKGLPGKFIFYPWEE